MAMVPRVIRARWEVESLELVDKSHYRVAAGPVPNILHVNKQSREEALKRYVVVNARICLDGTCYRRDSIFINFAIDTIFFVNFPEVHGFLTFNRVMSKNVLRGEKQPIRHIALSNQTIRWKYNRDSSTLAFFYQLVMQNPSLETITFINQTSSFEKDKNPRQYALKAPNPSFYESKALFLASESEKFNRIVGKLFTNIRYGTTQVREKFRKFLADRKDWEQPKIFHAWIAKGPKLGWEPPVDENQLLRLRTWLYLSLLPKSDVD
jgi:hypothetical protein